MSKKSDLQERDYAAMFDGLSANRFIKAMQIATGAADTHSGYQHYTTMKSLEKMIESRSLWLSRLDNPDLNDGMNLANTDLRMVGGIPISVAFRTVGLNVPQCGRCIVVQTGMRYVFLFLEVACRHGINIFAILHLLSQIRYARRAENS